MSYSIKIEKEGKQPKYIYHAGKILISNPDENSVRSNITYKHRWENSKHSYLLIEPVYF